MNTTSRAFTLIELMVVVAIIGLLSSVVITSLSSARSKAQDTTVKRNLATVRHQAALYLSSYNNYGPTQAVGACPTSGTSMFFTDATMRIAITAANAAGGGPTRCATDGTNYAMSAKLHGSANHWCVDSTSASREITNTTWTGNVCP
jgi:prepilin-type N-terminal cleavage/methylation domain-containing protein